MLEDTVWAICDEYTWSLPAHISWAKDERTDVDLFASETGYALTILKSEINARVYKRACEEIDRRILTSYEENTYDREKCTHNWAAVCAGSLGITFMHMAPKRFAKIKSHLHASKGWNVQIHKTFYIDHFSKKVTVYCIDYTTEPADSLTFDLKMVLK